jgi:acetone carboxylase gamma subunit
MKVDKQTIRDLIDEKLPRSQVHTIQSSYKDPDRFDKYVEILQEGVAWDDRIVLPFGEHLNIVRSGAKAPDRSAEGSGTAAKDSKSRGRSAEGTTSPIPSTQYMIKCDCGHEFCDYRENWKLEALIHVRETEEDLREIYPDKMAGDPRWSTLREYFCPGCKTLLEVEAVPPGYPVVHDFVPDLEGFYEDWLGRDLPR